jgi:primosomal protein N' (replication factor Y)
MPNKTFIDVAVELPMDKVFTYTVSADLSNQVEVGKRVLVPFGKRVVTGFCLGFRERSDIKGVKDILDVLDEEPLFDEKRLKFFQWVASYYFAPVSEVLSLICPRGINIKSQRYLYATEQNNTSHGPEEACGERSESIRSQKENLSPLSMEIFDVIRNNRGISLTSLLNKFKGKSIYSAINRLKNAGLVREELKIKSRLGEKTEIFVSPSRLSPLASHLLSKAPIQAKIISYLFQKGETSLKLLRKEFGSIDAAVKKLEQKGLVSLIQKQTQRDPLEDTIPLPVLHKPTDEQEKAISAICQGLTNKSFTPLLLYGVTGSGKTFVYLKALEQAVKLGRQAIFLVPEISLTPWPVKYLTALFPGRVAVLHSGLSDGERYDEWNRIKNGKVDIVIGARSAIFAPLKNPGIIIVDEEHESSYKQEEGVKYHARDLSLMMGKMFNLVVVLGSATPCVETFYNAKNGKITPLHLTKRVEERPMPEIELVDMKMQGQGARGKGQEENRKEIISEKLKSLMIENHRLGYQTILFLNRRGFSNFLICNDCGHSFQCLNCSVSLTMHKGAGILKCHYCDMSQPIPDRCPQCQSAQVKPIGVGTEQLEQEVRRILKKARIARMDRDTTRKKRSHHKILDAVDKGEVDVLVGTQMVAKGHHFPNVALVGIVSADTSINIPDFRSSERTFQLITQAAGRAGRGDILGTVIVQTLNPDHFCLRMAAEQNYEAFFEEELTNRQGLFYPPFSRLALLRFEGGKVEDVEGAAKNAKRFADNLLENGFNKEITVLGPVPAFLSKLQGKYRWQMLLKGKSAKSIQEFIRNILKCTRETSNNRVKLVIDVDPISTL